ncbi:hypothetical protein BVI2075_880032 [Burkholderia vietnamiensis]|nr:hypothetical protein BVI2075_880032 [Burkholderia vietnamiensis]
MVLLPRRQAARPRDRLAWARAVRGGGGRGAREDRRGVRRRPRHPARSGYRRRLKKFNIRIAWRVLKTDRPDAFREQS